MFCTTNNPTITDFSVKKGDLKFECLSLPFTESESESGQSCPRRDFHWSPLQCSCTFISCWPWRVKRLLVVANPFLFNSSSSFWFAMSWDTFLQTRSIHQSHPTVGRKSLSGLNGRPVALQPSATYKTEPMETRIGICCRWLFLFQTGGVGGGVSLANVSRRASANSGVCFTHPGHRLAAQMWEPKVEPTATEGVDVWSFSIGPT